MARFRRGRRRFGRRVRRVFSRRRGRRSGRMRIGFRM